MFITIHYMHLGGAETLEPTKVDVDFFYSHEER